MSIVFKHDWGDNIDDDFPNTVFNREISENFCWSAYYEGNEHPGDCWCLDLSKRKSPEKLTDDMLFMTPSSESVITAPPATTSAGASRRDGGPVRPKPTSVGGSMHPLLTPSNASCSATRASR